MQKRVGEISVGIFMVLAALALMFLVLKVSGLTVDNDLFGRQSYQVSAEFGDIGNLKVRAPVRVAGVEIGQVVNITLDPANFQAKVTLRINNAVNDLPSDTSASVTSSGILGDNYISLTPGYAATNLQNGSVINTTYSATSIQSLISTFMSGSKSNASH